MKTLLGLRWKSEVAMRDRANNAIRYADELGLLEIPPNGDDFNAIIGMLEGQPYRSPHKSVMG